MHTCTMTFALENDSQRGMISALAHLRRYEPIVAPTDTVYGIMCLFNSPRAIQRIYAVKQRPAQKALPVLIGDLSQLDVITDAPLTAMADTLARRFWPGPLTLVLTAHKNLPQDLTAGGATVGVRMPDHDALRELMRRAGPLAATSANRSGDKEAHTAQEAFETLDGLVPLILSDDGLAHRPQPVASTVIDVTGAEAVIMRTGPIADDVREELARIGGGAC